MRDPRPERWNRRAFLRGLMMAGASGWLGRPLRPAAAELPGPPVRSRIKIIGLGGGAGHALTAIVQAGMPDVEMMAADTDLQALRANLAPRKILLGARLTHGLGARTDPVLGRRAALAGRTALAAALDEGDLVVVLAGLGGGTGTGAAPLVAHLARRQGGLTVGVVTIPFPFESHRRSVQADAGLRALSHEVDILITLANQRVWQGPGEPPPPREAFRLREEVWCQAVHSLVELLTAPELGDADMPEARTLMPGARGRGFLGTATACGAGRAVEAAQHALACPLSDEASLTAARGVLVTVAGGLDLTLCEVNEAARLVAERAHEEAQILFSSVFDERLQGVLRVSVLATKG
jgi:cell division protein FtsZ